MFQLFAYVMVAAFATAGAFPPRNEGALWEVVRISTVDVPNGKFTIEREEYVYVLRTDEAEVERGDRKVIEWRIVTVGDVRTISENYSIKYWRLVNTRGKEFDWSQAEGKTVMFVRSNQLFNKSALKLLTKDALILYGRE